MSESTNSSRVYDLLGRYSLVAILLLGIVIFSIATPSTFFTTQNLWTIANEQIVVVLLALGVTIVLIVGEFDLSIGYVLGLAQALVVGFVAKSGMPVGAALVVVLAITSLVGLVNGVLVVYLRINALIATLATGSVLTGVVLWYTDGRTIFENVPPGFTDLARTKIGDVPLPIFYGAIVVILLAVFFAYFASGRRLYAIGGNREAAALNGIAVPRMIVGAFVASGLLSGAAGVIIASQLGTAQPGLGPGYLLPAFAAAFLGATAIRPGQFNILGTVIGVYVLAVPISGLQQMGVANWFEHVFNGIALIVAVALSGQIAVLRARRARRARLRAVRLEESAAQS